MPKNLKPAPREPYEPDEITLSIAKNGSDQNAWEFSTLARADPLRRQECRERGR